MTNKQIQAYMKQRLQYEKEALSEALITIETPDINFYTALATKHKCEMMISELNLLIGLIEVE